MIDGELMDEIREAAAQGKTSLIEEVCKRCDGDGVIYTGDWFSPKEYCPTCNGIGKEKAK